jgi:hypothetical protein
VEEGNCIYFKTHTKPSGFNAHFWLADYPFSNMKHFMSISAKTDTYGCGWCKKKGKQITLERYFAEMKSLKESKGIVGYFSS